jgi:predicted nucleotidyltransferase component of viral defense system/predicted transcriptional regulator of viral defense system
MDERPTGEYGLSAGIALARSLADAGLYVFTTDDAVDLRPPDVAATAVPRLLKSLADARWIIRLRRGLYAGTGRLPGGVDVPPFAIATSLVKPSAIAHLSALARHGLTDQIPLVVTAITPRKAVMPSMRGTKPAEGQHVWHAAGLDFRYVVVIPERFSFGIDMIWLDERFRVPVTDRERTVLDLFAMPRVFGGLGEGLAVLERVHGEIDVPRLVGYALRYGSIAVAKRLGWSLEETGTSPAAFTPLLDLPASSYSTLDPAIFARADVGESLVFKGGTALHKAYFPDYRFSVDLDFTARGGPLGDRLERTVEAVARDTETMLGEYGPFVVTSARRRERSAHPSRQEAFLIQIQFPWHRSPRRSAKIEITVDEPLALAAQTRPLLHRYGESLAVSLPTYRLEEIVAEKLRTTLQAQKRVDEESWARNCARDYYDLWYLFQLGEGVLDLQTALKILPKKCAIRNVSHDDAEDFFPPLISSEAERQWETSLADLVRPLPSFETVMKELRASLRALLGGR